MATALQRENETNPAKRPIWQGCGCIIFLGFFAVMFALSMYGVYMRSENGESYSEVEKDNRRELLDNDINKLSSILHHEKDSLSIQLQKCIDYDIESGINTDEIEYYTKIEDEKMLILLSIKDLKQVKPRERKVIIDIVEDCISGMSNLDSIGQFYIGVEGKWNTVLVKTPTEEDLGGRFADKYKLLPFYGEKKIPTDTIQKASEILSDSIIVE